MNSDLRGDQIAAILIFSFLLVAAIAVTLDPFAKGILLGIGIVPTLLAGRYFYRQKGEPLVEWLAVMLVTFAFIILVVPDSAFPWTLPMLVIPVYMFLKAWRAAWPR